MSLLSIAFLLSHGGNVLFAILLVIATIRLYLYARIKIILILTGIMIFWAITNFLLILPIIFSDLSTRQIETIASWNILGSAIPPALFILFVDIFEGRIDPKKVAFSFLTMGAAAILALSGYLTDIDLSSTIVEIDDLTTMRWSPLASIVIFPIVLVAAYWTNQELSISKKFAIDEKQIRQLRTMQIGVNFTFLIGPIFGVIGVVLVDGFNQEESGTWASEIIGYSLVSFGVFLFTIAYILSKEIAFLQPQRIETLLVIYNTGIPILQYEFRPDVKMESELALVSGAITAITALMDEAFNVSTNIKQIAFHDKELVLEFYGIENSGEEIAFILIGDRSSSFIEQSVNRFAKEFIETYGQELAKGMGLQIEDREKVIPRIRLAFGLESEK